MSPCRFGVEAQDSLGGAHGTACPCADTCSPLWSTNIPSGRILFHPRFSQTIAMPIELPKEARQQAITSIERYFREHMDEPIGNVAAGGLLSFFLQEIGPSVYNRAVADAQERLLGRVQELDIEVHEDEFGYWKSAAVPKSRGGR
jgi:uncharacterized protein (DUF2164 family)